MRSAWGREKAALLLSTHTWHAPSGIVEFLCSQGDPDAEDAQHDGRDCFATVLSEFSHRPSKINHVHPL